MRKTRLNKYLAWIALVICAGLLVILAPKLNTPELILADDFSHFWASSRLFINQGNPYHLEATLKVLSENGITPSPEATLGFQTLNPPWALLLFTPFSFLDYNVARMAWLIANITLVLFVSRQLWRIYSQSTKKQWIPLLVTLCFGPTFSALSKGQVTLWVILGITFFLLYSLEELNMWWAGFGLVLITIKPQLFYLLWPVLGFWVIQQRRWKLVASGAIVWFTGIILLLLVNPQVFLQFFSAAQAYPYDQWATPTIGSYLRFFWLGVDKFWIQYLPVGLAIFWSIFHFFKHKKTWKWQRQLPIMVIVSLLTSPYAWTYDQVIFIPLVIIASAWLSASVTPATIIAWLVYLVINLADLLLHTKLDDFWFLWLAPAYAIWYLLIYKWHQKNEIKLIQ